MRRVLRIVAGVTALALLGLGVAEQFHHSGDSLSESAIGQPATPSKDDPGEGTFHGPPHERRALRPATPTEFNGLFGVAGEARASSFVLASLLVGIVTATWLLARKRRFQTALCLMVPTVI